jgi:hypothetical protein
VVLSCLLPLLEKVVHEELRSTGVQQQQQQQMEASSVGHGCLRQLAVSLI